MVHTQCRELTVCREHKLFFEHYDVQCTTYTLPTTLTHTSSSFPVCRLVRSDLYLHRWHFSELSLPWQAHRSAERREMDSALRERGRVRVQYRVRESEFYSSLWPDHSSIIDGSVDGRRRGWPWNAPSPSCGSVVLLSWTWFQTFTFFIFLSFSSLLLHLIW